jgi:hypothetical protein
MGKKEKFIISFGSWMSLIILIFIGGRHSGSLGIIDIILMTLMGGFCGYLIVFSKQQKN